MPHFPALTNFQPAPKGKLKRKKWINANNTNFVTVFRHKANVV